MLTTKPDRQAHLLAARNRRPTAPLPSRRARRRPVLGCPKLASGVSPSPRLSASRSRRPECQTHAGVSPSRGCDLTAGPRVDPNTGLIYLHARYYDPATGQFITSDPLEAVTQRPYSYAGDDPVNETDPSGLACGVSTSSVGSFFGGLGGDITGCPEAAASTVWNYTGGAVYNYLSTHTVGLCANFSGGAGVVGTAEGCVALVGGSPTLIGALGFGAGSPSVQVSGGVLISNAQSACELNGWFSNLDGSVGEGPTLGDQVSVVQTSSGRNIWENQVTVGLGISLPTPFQLHEGASYTWTS